MKYAIWKHYHQHASSHSDEIFLGAGASYDSAVTTALELFSDACAEDERSDDELKALFRDDKALDTGDYALILVSDDHEGTGSFELINESASQVRDREVRYIPF